MSQKKAFTMIELLVVITIIGILSSLIIVSMKGVTSVAQDTKAEAGVDALRKTVLAYGIHSGGTYPIETTKCVISGGCPNLTSALVPDYYASLPTDTNYTYVSNTDGTSFTVSATLSNSNVYSYTSSLGFSTGPAWNCGDSITFTYRGGSVTYGTLTKSGKCWMDRNLGASRVATGSTDSTSYGDLFQWGRLDDGHQSRTSGTTAVLSPTDVPGHSNFITATPNPRNWEATPNANLWQGVNGVNKPCPTGWRLPTSAEWISEMGTWSSQNLAGAYGSTLKLPANGARDVVSAGVVFADTYGYYWSSSPDTNNAYRLRFDSGTVVSSTDARGNGMGVRCIKD